MAAVWMYWEDLPGSGRAPYLDLCMETVACHGSDLAVAVVDERTIHDYVDIPMRSWGQLQTPVQRSDYARVRLLHQYGGLWLDSDVIALRPLGVLLQALDEHEVVSFGREAGDRIYNCLMAARAGAALLERWMDLQDEVICSGKHLGYSALGQDLVWPMRNSVGMWRLEEVAPVMWWEWRRYTARTESVSAVCCHDPVTAVLWNKGMYAVFGETSRRELLMGRRLLSRMLRLGLGISTAAEEEDALTRVCRLNAVRFSRTGRRIEALVRGAASP